MKETRKAYKVAYLMGVSEEVMSREFPEHYRATKKGNYFKNYKDVEIVRALNRARQNIVRYNHLYTEGRTITEITNKPMSKELQQLKNEGLDVDLVYGEYGQKNYINILTKLINERMDGVLTALEVPDIGLIKGLFYFPIYRSEKEFEAYIKEQHNIPRPHGTIVYNGCKVINVIPYLFNNNYNMYATATAIKCTKTLTLGDMHNETFEWETKKLNEANTPIKLEEVLKELRLYESTADMVVSELPQEILTSNKGCLGVFVDTRSIDIYKIISYLELAQKDNTLGKVVIYGGTQENQEIKGIIPHIIPDVCIEFVTDEWSTKRDNKRIVGMVTDIVKSRYKDGIEKAVIFTENRLIEGLIRQEPCLEYVIGMEGTDIDVRYKEYLDSVGVEVVDFSAIDGSKVLQAYKGITFKYIMAQTLTEMPIQDWDMLTVSESLWKQVVVKEMQYTETEVLNKVEKLIDKVQVEVTKGKKYVILEEERIEIK